jgi:hypothetical protein
MNIVLQKTKRLSRKQNWGSERLHNPQETQLGQRKTRTPRRIIPLLLQLLSSRFLEVGEIARMSTLMVGAQQVWEINDMHVIITRIRL